MTSPLAISVFNFPEAHFLLRKIGLMVVLGLAGAAAAEGQLQGKISTAKEVYVAGEPIYVHFEVTNAGNEPVEYGAGDPYSEGCGGYAVEVSKGPALEHPSCRPMRANECTAANQILSAGETVRQNILVNYAHEVKTPGDYQIRAVRELRYRVVSEPRPAAGKDFRLEKTLQIHMQKGDRDTLQAIYQVYVRNLGSQDDEIQRDAERAIVSGGMPWLEETILGMVRQYRSREFALLGLRNLNTPRARDELARMVQNTSEQTAENEMAVVYLSQMGDKKYLPALLNIAKRQPADQARAYVQAVAELGGDDALPYLRELAGNQDIHARANSVTGLGVTGSRQAVPLLVEELTSGTADLAKLAENALTTLTHRRVSAEEDPPPGQARKWAAWWAAEGSTAKVYGPRECGEVEELP